MKRASERWIVPETSIHDKFEPGLTYMQLRGMQEWRNPKVPKGIMLLAISGAVEVLDRHEDVLVDILKQWEQYRMDKTIAAMGTPFLNSYCPVKKLFMYRILHTPRHLLVARNFDLDYENVRECVQRAATYVVATAGYLQITKPDIESYSVYGKWSEDDKAVLFRLAMGQAVDMPLIYDSFLVKHHMAVVSGLCDIVTVLDGGRVIAEGTVEEIRRNPRVIEAYLGSSQIEDAPLGSTLLHAEPQTV